MQRSVYVQLLAKAFPVLCCVLSIFGYVCTGELTCMIKCASATSSVVLAKKTALHFQLVHQFLFTAHVVFS